MSRILQTFSELGYMDESNQSVVLYGMQRIKNLFIDFLISVTCGWLMGNVLVGILFEAAFIPLRIYAGGYHAHNRKICALISWGSIVMSIAIINYLPIALNVQHILTYISFWEIITFAPIESENRPLSGMEKRVFRSSAITVLMVECGIYIISFVENSLFLLKIICIAMLLVASGMLLEKSKNIIIG